MSAAEVEFRFIDCLKLQAREQQSAAGVLLNAVGSLLVKKGENNYFDVLNNEIKFLNDLILENSDYKQADIRVVECEEEKQKRIEQKNIERMLALEAIRSKAIKKERF